MLDRMTSKGILDRSPEWHTKSTMETIYEVFHLDLVQPDAFLSGPSAFKIVLHVFS